MRGRKRVFSPEQVNALIPKLELLMEKIQRCGLAVRKEVEAVAAELGRDAETLGVEDLLSRRPEVRGLIREIEKHTDDIHACGGEFKGFDLGLVDFPAEIEGQEALLCWQFGEKEVAYWHTPEAGFAERRPLEPVRRHSTLQ